MNRLWLVLVVLALGLVACPQATKPPAPTFTIRLEPAVLNLRVTETGVTKVIVSRAGGFAEAITVTLEGETTGLEVEPLTVTEGEGTLRFLVTDDAKPGTSFPVVKAAGGAVERSETLTLRVEQAVANVTEVVVKDNGGSREVRQGFGEARLVVSGSNLERVTSFGLGDLSVSLLEQSAARLELAVAVPHAAPIGTKDLLLTTEGGDVSVAGAIVVTAITAGPGGSDDVGAGTTESPYRTLTHALSLSQRGDTVRLLSGRYGAASGEAWPQVGAGGLEPGPNIPAGVRVEGESRDSVTLAGSAPSAAVALAFAGDGEAANLTLEGFAAGLFVTAGEVAIDELRAAANDTGLVASGGRVTVTAGEFAGGGLGVLAVGEAQLELLGGSSHDNDSDGVRLGDGAPSLSASGFAAYSNRRGLAASGEAAVLLEASTLRDNREQGLAGSERASVSCQGCEIYGNAGGGLLFGGASLRLRGTTIRDNPVFGAYIEGQPERVDFGNFTEPGNNVLRDNAAVEGAAGGDQLLDVRSDLPTVGAVVFTMRATTFNGVEPAPDIYPGNGVWPYLNAPYFSILGVNNVIQAY